MLLTRIKTYLTAPVKAAPLAVFRVLFGGLMLFATARFLSYGWVDEFLIEPEYHFTYFGLEWVRPLGNLTYVLYAITFMAALGIAFGWYYRLATVLFFLSFTYCELIDKTIYLNHYYFVSLVAFLLIFLPANSYFSLDAKRNPKIAYDHIPRYSILAIQLLLAIVYFYAGLAKINSDWLLRAMPLKIWLPVKYDLPLLGSLFQKEWMHYFMSWSGMLYDLCIPFLLFHRKTRTFAFVLVVIFHVLTRVLFPIGVFPYVMILSTLIFFDAAWHERRIAWTRKWLKLGPVGQSATLFWIPNVKNKLTASLLIVFFAVQLAFPFRYLLYPDELFWTEEGYRFSWRVMLMEKGGYVQYKVVDPENQRWFYVDNAKFLTEVQQKQLSTQADFILAFAHYLEAHYKKKGIEDPEIYADSFIALNGRLSQRFIDPKVDLTKVEESFGHKEWILPFNDTIYGF